MLKFLRFLSFITFLLIGHQVQAQLAISPAGSAQALAQKLVGEGITISNVSFTGDASMFMAGHFVNQGGTSIDIDSGIVLTTGRAKTAGFSNGVDGDANLTSSNGWGLNGDPTLATAMGIPLSEMEDACILEFDFVPLGDTIRFNYVFSSEEYTASFVCSFNDAFGFFISGPGITGVRNIALVPNTNLPVSILNVNNVDPWNPNLCPNNINYYVDNTTNPFFMHDGHTTTLTAVSQVQPCQTYHLKLVISDNADDVWDSGVFLEAKSLSSNAVALINNTQHSPQGDDYLVEGCVPGSFTIRRPLATPAPLTVNLQYFGTATNGVDVLTMPATVTIPANQTDVIVTINPVIDNIPEGIEFVKVYSMAACASAGALPIDSTVFQIRDYDILGITPADSSVICRNSSLQLTASSGYTTYQWTPATGLSNTTIPGPVATPVGPSTTYIAHAIVGTCNAMDSVYIEWKQIELDSTRAVNCSGGTTGQIYVSAGSEWATSVQYSINNGPYQNSGFFNNLPAGTHMIYVNDGTCLDSMAVLVSQAFPDLLIPSPIRTPGNCTGTASGSITVNATGGRPPYEYSINGGTFQSDNLFMVASGLYDVTVRDANGCLKTYLGVDVPFINSVSLSTGADPTICESKDVVLSATASSTVISWTPTATLSNPTIANPVANPVVTTTYYVTATTGICSKTDSITVFVNPAPTPDAGADASICFGGTTSLSAGPAMEYKWRPVTFLSNSTVAQPNVIRPTSPTTYYLKIKDFNGCESLTEDTVKVHVTPAVRMFAGNDTIIGVGQPLQLNGVQIGAPTVTTFSWTPSYGLSNPNIANPIAILDKDMEYTLTGTTDINCEGSAVIKVKVYKGPEIYVPSVFTPNGDGRNDILRAWAIGMKEYRYFRVYNRWGALVFTTSDFNRGWDGKIKGSVQGTGSYVWMAEAVDYRGNVITRKGTTTIIQ